MTNSVRGQRAVCQNDAEASLEGLVNASSHVNILYIFQMWRHKLYSDKVNQDSLDPELFLHIYSPKFIFRKTELDFAVKIFNII